MSNENLRFESQIAATACLSTNEYIYLEKLMHARPADHSILIFVKRHYASDEFWNMTG